MRKFAILFAVIAAVALLSASTPADAAIYSSVQDSETFSLGIGNNTTIYLDKFDPTLGTLVSVTLTLDADASAGSITWDNEAANPSTVILGIGATVTATAPSSLTLVAVPLQQGSGSVAADSDGDADFIGGDAFSVTGGTGSDSDTDSPASPFTGYVGTGEQFAVDITTLVKTYLETNGGYGPLDYDIGQTSGTVTVVYEYIPEPMTMGVLGLGGLGLLLRRRRA